MKPMLLTLAAETPLGREWRYEAKYDGFRCILEWVEWEKEPILTSRNGNLLNAMFPEIISFCKEINESIKNFLPLALDGELVYLSNNFQSNFSIVQQRGRLRNQEVIKKQAHEFPCHFIVFDLLKYKGESRTSELLSIRKSELQTMFHMMHFPTSINYEDIHRFQLIDVFENSDILWNKIFVNNGEGIVAKNQKSIWSNDKRTSDWLKVKNWRYVTVILTKYDQSNNYFHCSVYDKEKLLEVVTFRHGLQEQELQVLITLFQSNGTKLTTHIWELEPSICVEIKCIDFDGKSLREPRFHRFNLDKDPATCSWQQMQRQLYPLPEKLQVTHLEKTIWPSSNIQKDDYLLYLQNISPFILPFLRNRQLTVIRFPHGVIGESFYQKNWADNLPSYIETKQMLDTRFVLCNDLETLLWLGNQLVLEFHIPFQTIQNGKPTEIVFDLDPPSVQEFSLAVEAAIRMKAIFDHFELPSFVKTSGGKGLQVYIPLPVDTYSYEDTRLFTKFVCDFLCEQEPQWFTTERLKKNRHKKLYLDYVQHHEGKTIISPYSPRGNEKGLIATPLSWDEVCESLRPDIFSIPTVLERIKKKGNPFRDFRHKIDNHQFAIVLSKLKELKFNS